MPSEAEAKREAGQASGRSLDGATLRRMLTMARVWIERNAASLDAINVYPVPDGDTGSNLSRTLSAAAEGTESTRGESVGAVAAAAARGALLGARGNSGVIFSQWLAGMAGALEGRAEASAAQVQAALAAGSAQAYGAIGEPREGTILSVARAVAEVEVASEEIATLLEAATEAAREAVERTPEQMPLLAAAGVVDAGAQGLAMVLEAMLWELQGKALPAHERASGRIDPAWLSGSASDGVRYGYCTEFVVEARDGATGSTEAVRSALLGFGESLMVVGLSGERSGDTTNGDLLHVHIHASDPEAVYAVGAQFGVVSRQKAEDITQQHAALLARYEREGAWAIVAVAAGPGFTRIFHDLGVAAVIPGGASQNPSAEDILDAARRTHAMDVIVLPNHPNVRPAAAQAANLAEAIRVHVVPTESDAAVVAALSAVPQGAGVAEVVRRMEVAAAEVLHGSVTHAARAVTSPLRLRKGQPMALLNGELVAGAETATEALELLVATMLKARPTAELLTIYRGAEADEAEMEAAVAQLEASFDGAVEIEVVIGDQPHYPFLASLE
jgi:DAK2 domain fusion protein YloV